jgi:hypothetical protein
MKQLGLEDRRLAASARAFSRSHHRSIKKLAKARSDRFSRFATISPSPVL